MSTNQFIKLFLQAQEKNLLEDIELVRQHTKESITKHNARPADDGMWPPKVFSEELQKSYGVNSPVEWIKNNGRKTIAELERQLKKVKGDMKFGRKSKLADKITPEMIEKAKAFPIEQLVEVNKQGFTKCFEHNDKKPSVYCKKNFLHCFVCNKSWDTIAVLVERDGISFKEAVLKLQ